ncbi:MAG: PIG-L family deacetylase, partial [Candidatus Woesearchaeota archaeon]|nr:PIG-L family deacetylase [Candidatus Woesearchaeota archaeon]
MPQTILTICAHNDDQIVGAGGTLAKYAAEGKRIRTVICSFGESSHPHLKREIIVERRVKESLRADKILGGSGVAYFGLAEGKFLQ